MSLIDNSLAHFGVKGMRWGVRRRSGGLGRRAKPVPSEDKQRAEAAKSKIGRRGNTDALTNQELQLVIGRMNLEQQIARYSANQKKTVLEMLANTGKDEFVRFAQGKETKIIGTALAMKGINTKPVGRHIKKK